MLVDLTPEQVTSVHVLYAFLRKLKVIGVVKTKTEQVRCYDIDRPIRYSLIFVSYDPSMKNRLTTEETLEEYFKRLSSLLDAHGGGICS